MLTTNPVFLEVNMGAYRPNAVWLLCSVDLSLLDYGIWGIMKAKFNAIFHPNVDPLKQTIRQEWCPQTTAKVWRTWLAFRPWMVAILINSQGNTFLHQLKPFPDFRLRRKNLLNLFVKFIFYCLEKLHTLYN
jgi:hypothetical protein